MGENILGEDDQYFRFRNQNIAMVFIDGNYMINISRALSLKIDMEKLIDELSKEFFRRRSYWYSALESNLDKSNSTFRFLDRLRYIPRTKVYAGRLAKKQIGHIDLASKTDAGIALAIGMVEQAMQKNTEYILLIANDPVYVPAIRMAQRYGAIVRIISLSEFADLRPHPELIKVGDESFDMDEEFLDQFEYVSISDEEDEKQSELDEDIGDLSEDNGEFELSSEMDE